MNPYTLYLTFGITSFVANTTGAVFGLIWWRKLNSGLQIIVGLLVFGALWDVFSLYLITSGTTASRIWLSVNAFLQVVFILGAAIRLGNDVYMSFVGTALRVVLVCYSLAWFAVLYFMPEWFRTPYIPLGTYFLIVVMVGMVVIEYSRFGALQFSNAELWVYMGILLYYSGIVLLLLVKIQVPQMTPALYWLPHTALALVKNGFLIRAFYLESWNHTKQSSLQAAQ